MGLVCLSKVDAQTITGCGTPHNLPSAGSQNVAGRVAGPQSGWAMQLPCKKAVIRVAFHVVRDQNGNGGFDISANPNIHINALNILNAEFNAHNIFFVSKYVDGSGDPVLNEDRTGSYSVSLADLRLGDINNNGKFYYFDVNSNPDAIDIYFLGNGITSVDGLAPSMGATAIIYTGVQGATSTPSAHTICHEMGHCLGLYHTFFQTACNSYTVQDNRPNGNYNCEGGGMKAVWNPATMQNDWVYEGNGHEAGDYVWDTWADPTISYIGSADGDCRDAFHNNIWSHDPLCFSVPGLPTLSADLYGYPWKPLVNNFMDYGYDPSCTLKFTLGQVDRMLAAIANDANVNNTVVKGNPVSVNIGTSGGGSLSQCNPLTAVKLTANVNPDVYDYNWSGGPTNTPNTPYIFVAPTATTTYILTPTSRCMAAVAPVNVTVHVDDNVQLAITGPAAVCEGSTSASYSVTGTGSYTNGIWSVVAGPGSINGNPAAQSMQLDIAPLATGSITIAYIATSANCSPTITKTVQIVPQTAAVHIAASKTEICVGEKTILTATGDPGLTYSWSVGGIDFNASSTPNSVEVQPAATATYTLTGTTPCGVALPLATQTITVHALPVITAINPLPAFLCVNNAAPVEYSSTGAVGSWSGLGINGTNASISYDPNDPNTNHLLTATSPGDYHFYYAFTHSVTGCKNTVDAVMKIHPDILTLTASFATICASSQTTLFASIPGGTWTSADPGIASVDAATGVVTGIMPGTASFNYTTSLCGSQQTAAPITITVEQAPVVIQSKNVLCEGSAYQFTINPSGEVWSSLDPNVATVDATGMVTASKAGATTIMYTPRPNYFTACFTDPVYIPLVVIDCTPVACGSEQGAEIPVGTASGTFSGLLFLDNDITVTGTLTLASAQLRIKKGITITVTGNGKLNIYSSHLYACNGMWKGIEVVGDGAKVAIQDQEGQSSFIEDAETAILYKPSSYSQLYTRSHLLNIHGTIFNRNKVSIQIENLENVTGSPDMNLPISIYNCIFTSRDIPFHPAALAWDNVDAVKGTTLTRNTPYSLTPTSYEPPYIDYSNYPDDVANAFLKDGTGAHQQAGSRYRNKIYRHKNKWAIQVCAGGQGKHLQLSICHSQHQYF